MMAWLTALAALLAFPMSAQASDTTEEDLALALSGAGQAVVVIGAVALPFLDNEADAQAQALRHADAIASAWLVTQGLQRIVREKRPQGNSRDSFPSGHATAAFAAATVAADDHPEQAAYWYGAAAAIAWSRVRLKRHRTRDVLAGAALGYGMAKLEQHLPRGLLLAPFIEPEDGCTGVEAVWEF